MLGACWALVLGARAFPAGAATLEQQRAWFAEAAAAIEAGQSSRAERLLEKLDTYPLAPYLELWLARAAMRAGDDETVAETLTRHAEIPEAADIHQAWIESLARRGQWPRAGAELARRPDLQRDPALAGAMLLVRWHLGDREEARRAWSERYRQGWNWQKDPLADRLDRPFADWIGHGHPTPEEMRERFRRLAREGRWAQIDAERADLQRLRCELPDAIARRLASWRQAQADPARALSEFRSADWGDWAEPVFSDLIRRHSRQDVAACWEALRHPPRGIARSLVAKLRRRVALRAARHHRLEAHRWLAGLPRETADASTRAWRVRLLMLAGDWAAVRRAIRAMPRDERESARWRYWLGRAELELGHPEAARRLWSEVARERGYYGFLAARRLGVPASLSPAPSPEAKPATLRRLAGLPGMVRAREWLALGDRERAGREWAAALARIPEPDWRAVLQLAMDWGLWNQAIAAAWRAGAMDALDVRFPVGFANAVFTAAREHRLSPELVLGVIRQESAFNPAAVSRSGARGLMQLMPATARQVAHRLAIEAADEDLFDPEVNVRLGAAYLSRLLERFGEPALAVAAYNAGPARVSRWLERVPADDLELWVEAIPFDETRRYVQHVLAFRQVYRWRTARMRSEPVARAARVGSSG